VILRLCGKATWSMTHSGATTIKWTGRNKFTRRINEMWPPQLFRSKLLVSPSMLGRRLQDLYNARTRRQSRRDARWARYRRRRLRCVRAALSNSAWRGGRKPSILPIPGRSPTTPVRPIRLKQRLLARKSFTFSSDPHLNPLYENVNGLYVHPPANAFMRCDDYKAALQALESIRPGPSLNHRPCPGS